MCSDIPGMINHKGLIRKSRYRGRDCGFSTNIATLFGTPGEITGTGYQSCSETLFAGMGAGFTYPVILPLTIAAQEVAPIPTPLFGVAHRSLRSGTSRSGRFPSVGFCWAHSFLAASSRFRMEGFPRGSSLRPLLITPSIIL